MIYFITAREVGRVKIGYSADPFLRFSKVQSDNSCRLVLEATQEGSRQDEKALHQRFLAWRVQGEWFELSPEIQGYMDVLGSLRHSATRRESKIAALMAQVGCSYSYAAKMLAGNREITIPVAVSVFRESGERIGPLTAATDHEINILEKYCGRYTPLKRVQAA